jgi:hypothetical protein
MPLLDTLLWLIAALVPGVALIRLCWPDAGRLRILACAPPVSFGLCYAVGLASSRVSLSPVPMILVVSAGLAFGAVLVDVRRWRSSRITGQPASDLSGTVQRASTALAARPAGQLVSWLLLAAGVVLGTLLWRSFQSTMLVPVGWDAMHHGYFIEQISRFHTMKASVVLSSDTRLHDGNGTFYPLAFNVLAAVLHVSTGSAISTVMLTSTIALAGALLPLGCYALAIELDPTQPLVAGFSAITVLLPMMLYLVEGTGRITGILGIALVPGLVVLLLSQRENLRWATLPLAVLGIVGVAGVHTSEAPLAAIIATACMLTGLRRGANLVAARRWIGWLVAAGLIATIALVGLEPAVLNLVGERGGAIVHPSPRPGSQILHSALSAVGQAWLLPVAGCLAALLPRWRHYRGPALALGLFMALYFFIAHGTRTLVSTLAIPWYGDPGRISWDLTVLGAIPTAVGLAALAGLVGTMSARFARDRTIARWAPPALIAATALLVVIAFALPPVGRQGLLTSQVAGPVDQNSQAAFRYLRAHVGPNRQVLDDLRTDGAMWMYVDYGVEPLFGNSPFLGAAPHSWLQKLWLSRNLKNLGSDPCVRKLIDQFAIRYVYVGDLRMFDGWADFSSPGFEHNRNFTEVFHQGHSHVFVIRPAAGSARCQRDVTAGVHWG